MDKKNIIILGFAIVAIGLFVIPSTMSMFVGQHQWYSVRTADDQYDLCYRCHVAEVNEWKANTGAHATYNEIEKNGCFCHQINESSLDLYGFDPNVLESHDFELWNESGNISDDPASWEWRNKSTPHAAIVIGCEDCHYNATAQLSNEFSAHKAFFEAANATDYGTNNTACMACHTMIGLNITMERIKSGIIVDANHTEDYNWTVSVSTNTSETTSNATYYEPTVEYTPTP